MSESDFDRLFAMGILSLVTIVVGAVGVGFAMFKPKVAMWRWPRRLYPLGVRCRCVSRSAGADNPRGIAMVLFLWAAALEYVDSTQSKAQQGSSEEAVEATGTESGTVAEGT